MPVKIAQRLINVNEYHKMEEVGILSPNDRIELINGQIVHMSPIGSKHAACVDKIMRILQNKIEDFMAIVRCQNPVQIDDYSEPEPDISILRYKSDYYASELPKANDILLIIEVADSSYTFDKEIKLPLYAEAGIPEFWIINLEKKEIEAYRSPEGGQYLKLDLCPMGHEAVFRGLEMKVGVEEVMV